MAQKETKDKFSELYSLNVNGKVEQKNGLNYLSWAYAWAEFKKAYPDAVYTIKRNPEDNMPFFDSEYGIMVFTEVTAGGLTHEMWLPVMDGANKAMKSSAWTYRVWDKRNNAWIEKKVNPADMFDINKTIMRCLVKNLAMFGLGLYIYAGEDLPEENAQATADKVNEIVDALSRVHDMSDLKELFRANQKFLIAHPDVKQKFTDRKNFLLAQNA